MTSLGGSTTLGGAPKAATTLGGAPKAATTLGGAPKAATTLGGAPKTATTLGGAPKAATTLGGVPKAGATTLGGAPKPQATTLGASPSATPKAEPTPADKAENGEKNAAPQANGEAAPQEATPSPAPAANVKEAAKKAGNQAGAKKKGASGISALAEKLRKEKEERERLQREEEERIKREEEEERKLEEQRRIHAEKVAKEAEIQREKDKAVAAERKKQEAVENRAKLLARFGNAQVSGVAKKTDAPGSDSDTTSEASGAQHKGRKDRKALIAAAQAKAAAQAEADALAKSESAQDKPAVKSSWDDSDDEDDEGAAGEEGAETSDPNSLASSKEVSTDSASTTSTATAGTSGSAKPEFQGTLRSPICCVLGHVDTGKTKLLDKMRNTNVQDGEVGGITQQIGATYFPMETIKAFTAELNEKHNLAFKVPGLLVMDTPGHASFTNLRTRGSSLCDIAVLVVDIMHGLEPMTIESINLLRMRKTPFVVALNKVDRLFEWRAFKNKPIGYSLKHQASHVMLEYQNRVNEVIAQFAEQNLNAELYYNLKSIKDFARQVSLVPTSAITGEGIPDLLSLIVQLTQRMMGERLQLKDEFQCTVLEVKQLEGHGTTIDVILASGTLHEGDRILLCGLQGPIETTIRALLTPPPLRELRVKNAYQHHKELHAAQGVKISAPGMEKALAGSSLYVIHSDEEVEALRNIVMKPLSALREKIQKQPKGVYVQASTLGSLEALLDFLTTVCNIPIAEFGVGPIHARDVKIASVMLEKAPDYACILAFDVPMDKEARELAASLKVRVFEADIIYHLERMFKDHIDALAEARRSKSKADAIFPCQLTIKSDAIFNQRDPIILGVTVKAGVIRIGTPITVFSKTQNEWIDLGRIASAQVNHKDMEEVKAGDDAAISIVPSDGGQKYMYGRHFEATDELLSRITRNSLDALKEHYPEFCSQKPIFSLLKGLRKLFVDTAALQVPSSSS